ncbi:MAG: hypothetical protein C0490_25150 [Marivirga sp.]|nr:hypothetical protein [Marivirga sp.]
MYIRFYQSSQIGSIKWNGKVGRCACGQLQDDVYKKAEDRVNFFRMATGLQPVKLNPEFNLEAQKAALLIKANHKLTHYPTKGMKCFDDLAYNGCKKSCLGFTDFKNFPNTSFITGFIQDYGSANFSVGHRKWILYSKLVEFGYGATDDSEALLTVDGVSHDSIPLPEFIAYPWAGYVPIDLIFPAWSFSIPQARTVDFSQTRISMFDIDGNELKSVKLKERKNFLDHTIVWTAKGMFSDHEIQYGLTRLEEKGFLNKRIKVIIQNVRIDGLTRDFEYFVEPIKI